MAGNGSLCCAVRPILFPHGRWNAPGKAVERGRTPDSAGDGPGISQNMGGFLHHRRRPLLHPHHFALPLGGAALYAPKGTSGHSSKPLPGGQGSNCLSQISRRLGQLEGGPVPLACMGAFRRPVRGLRGGAAVPGAKHSGGAFRLHRGISQPARNRPVPHHRDCLRRGRLCLCPHSAGRRDPCLYRPPGMGASKAAGQAGGGACPL